MAGQQITGLTVEGYKSFGKKQHLQIRPLTLLAGANSSGKSSVIQPLLLLKQTLDSAVDPGPLKIDGPNVAFSWKTQMFTHCDGGGEHASAMAIGLEYDYEDMLIRIDKHGSAKLERPHRNRTIELEFQCTRTGPVALTKETISEVNSQNGSQSCNRIEFSEGELPLSVVEDNAWLSQTLRGNLQARTEHTVMVAHVVRTRCFLDLEVTTTEGQFRGFQFFVSFNQELGPLLSSIIYIPGLRDPASVRSYPLMPITENFPGPMHSYLASIVHDWGPDSDSLDALEQDLRKLGLAEKVAVEAVSDTALEVLVGGYLSGSEQTHTDLVSLADVGLGLSQVMPVLAALRVARPHHLVVMEQPELHLHPRGIHKLAEVIVGAVSRGVRIIMETHSELLLLGIQTLVAKGRLDPALVSLNWFSLDEQGHSHICQAEIEKDGSFGDWPVDFLDVELSAQRQYLDAVSNHE